MSILIKNCTIINEGYSFAGSISIDGDVISGIYEKGDILPDKELIIDAEGLFLMPGIIDDQVHFREPGNPAKGTIESESAASVLGGVTSFMDMPNTNPPAVTLEILEKKYEIAKRTSYANYSFYLGGSNDNLDEILKADPSCICGLKIFMGSSTGNLLVDNPVSLEKIFSKSPLLIASHCEDNSIIGNNLAVATEKYGEDIPFEEHKNIRSREACIKSSQKAIDLALRNNSSLHILHISTREEIEMIKEAQKRNPNITGEVCVHYMLLDSSFYGRMGSKMKCNPAIKDPEDRIAIIKAVKDGIIKVVATDHAPHTISEKYANYKNAPSGLPLIQHSFQIMWELHKAGYFTPGEIADRMCHSPAHRFKVQNRGYIRVGYYADIMLFNPDKTDNLTTKFPAYKCGWSPFGESSFSSSVIHTFVNGIQVVKDGMLTGEKGGKRLKFNHEK